MDKTKKLVNCYFCGKPVTEDDLCYGCEEYVCQECDQTQPMGCHEVNDHREMGSEE